MNKAQKIAVGFIIVAILVIAGLYFVLINKSNNTEKNYYVCENPQLSSEIIFYYGDTCPHCKIVEQWMNENNVLGKINITQKEVFENQTNGQELMSLGNKCKLPQSYLGAVPLLYVNEKAYIGDKDIIDFLNKTIRTN